MALEFPSTQVESCSTSLSEGCISIIESKVFYLFILYRETCYGALRRLGGDLPIRSNYCNVGGALSEA